MAHTQGAAAQGVATDNLRQAVAARAETILRRPAVEARTGLSRSTIYAMMARGEFPQPVRIGVRAVGWKETDVAGWLANREVRGAY